MSSPDAPASAVLPDYGVAGTLRACLRLAVILAWIFLNIPLQIVFCLLRLPVRFTFPHFFHRIITRVFMHMKIEVRGTPSTAKPTLFLSNHLSYADIPVMSAVLATSFVSRAEVANWPLLGLLAKLQHTVFVERRARHQVHEQNDDLRRFLAVGNNLVLFPEGTSTNGLQVLPFKSSLIQGIFELGETVVLQPVSLACLNTDGSQHLYPWYGDMGFPEHAWPFLKVPRFHMRITFHAPLKAGQFSDRKALADQAYKEVINAEAGVRP